MAPIKKQKKKTVFCSKKFLTYWDKYKEIK